MLILGITGGSGSGKTTVLKLIEDAYVIDCDELYHELLENDDNLIGEICSRFPEAENEGRVERKILGKIVFNDSGALRDLNKITHRYVADEVKRRLEMSGAKIAAIDAVALIESGIGRICDYIIGVIAPEELRVSRLLLREGISEQYARLRIAAQKPDSFFEENCDFIISNDTGDLNDLRLRWMEIFNQINERNELHEQGKNSAGNKT